MLEPRLCSHRSSTYRSTTELILNVKVKHFGRFLDLLNQERNQNFFRADDVS